MALLRSKNEYRAHIARDINSAQDAYDMFHHELWRFGIIQHSERGWYHMDAEVWVAPMLCICLTTVSTRHSMLCDKKTSNQVPT